MKPITHDVQQGAPEWLELRKHYYTASDSGAMLGLNAKKSRAQLLLEKHTGIAPEHGQYVQDIFAKGHATESAARILIEYELDEELYPVTMSMGKLLASCDGLTMRGHIAFEHKLRNAQNAAIVDAGEVPPEHMPQCQQVMLVTGATQLIFAVSNGDRESLRTTIVHADEAWFRRLQDGWAQFEDDLQNFVPPAPGEVVTAHTADPLPALYVEFRGEVTTSNFEGYRKAAKNWFAGVNQTLETDQDFANAKADVKVCYEIEEKIATARERALNQTATINDVLRDFEALDALSRKTRLALDKLVKQRELEIKTGIVTKSQKELEAHVQALNDMLKAPYMPKFAPDFGSAIKGLRTLKSVQNAVDGVLVAAKIEAAAVAKTITRNFETMAIQSAGGWFDSLFPDLQSIITKSPDDFERLVKDRIATHEAAMQAKAERDAKAKQEAEEKAAMQVAATVQPSSHAPVFQLREKHAALAESVRTMKLGDISAQLGFTVTADFLASLGFFAQKERGACLYFESDYRLILMAMINHLTQQLESAK